MSYLKKINESKILTNRVGYGCRVVEIEKVRPLFKEADKEIEALKEIMIAKGIGKVVGDEFFWWNGADWILFNLQVKTLMSNYYQGKGCKCWARAASDCVCGVDWTDPKVYDLHAKIDALMLEYCPDEMTPEQLKRYEESQVNLQVKDHE